MEPDVSSSQTLTYSEGETGRICCCAGVAVAEGASSRERKSNEGPPRFFLFLPQPHPPKGGRELLSSEVGKILEEQVSGVEV